MEAVTFKIASVSQHEEIMEFLYQNFYNSAPVCKGLNIMDDGNVKRICHRDHEILKTLKENMSLLAISKDSGEILGKIFLHLAQSI